MASVSIALHTHTHTYRVNCLIIWIYKHKYVKPLKWSHWNRLDWVCFSTQLWDIVTLAAPILIIHATYFSDLIKLKNYSNPEINAKFNMETVKTAN